MVKCAICVHYVHALGSLLTIKLWQTKLIVSSACLDVAFRLAGEFHPEAGLGDHSQYLPFMKQAFHPGAKMTVLMSW